METRRGRRSVIDLTAASVSPPEIPRPLIATASIAPRRRLRDGSHSSRSSTAASVDLNIPANNAIQSGSRNRGVVTERRNSDGAHGRNGSSSSGSRSGPSRTLEASNGEPRPKRARLSLNSDEGESRGSGTASRSSRPSASTTASTSRLSSHSTRNAAIDDFGADTSDEAALEDVAGQSSSGGVVPGTDDEDDKTDVMTVNTDILENDLHQYQFVEDSSQESSRLAAAGRQAVNPDEVDELADNTDEDNGIQVEDDDDDAGFEVVSHVQRPKNQKETNSRNGGHELQHGSKGNKGKGKAPVKVDPDEPPENLLASFECPICFMPPVQAVLTPCGHIMCGKCLFDTLKSQAIRDGKRPNAVGQYPPIRPTPGKKMTRKDFDLERSRPPLKGRILSGSCPVCRMELEGGFGTVPGEGGVKYLEIRTMTEL